MTNDEQLIRQVIADWMRASEAGETEAVLNLMAEDAVFLLPGQAPIRGHQGFAAMSRAMQEKVRVEGHSEIQEIQVDGDFAYCWSYLTITVTPTGGEPVTKKGHILSVFRREPDGRWLLFRDANLLG